MMRHHVFIYVSVLLLLLISCDSETPVTPEPEPELTVEISSPNTNLYTNSTVTIQLVITGGTPDEVVLLANDNALVSLSAPYTYTWDTNSISEGSYALKARASLSGKNFESPPRTITIDRTAPEITNRTPSPNNLNVAASTPIKISFSEPINPASITNSSVVLNLGATETSKNLTLNPNNDTLTITPGAFNVPNNFKLSLSPTITDLAGNPLNLSSDTWTWTTPFWLQLGDAIDTGKNRSIYRSIIETDSSDNVVAAWAEGTGDLSNYDVYVKRWDGVSWMTLGGALDANGTSGALVNDVSLDKNGNPYVLWQELVSPSGLYVWHWNGTAWETLGDKINATSVNNGSLSVDSAGHPVVTWSERHTVGDSFRVYVKTWTGTDWLSVGSGAALNTNLNNIAISPQITFDASGFMVIAWSEREPGSNPYSVYVKRWNGAVWQQLGGALNFSASKSSYLGGITVDTNNNPIVSFTEIINNDNRTAYVKHWNGTSWSSLYWVDIDSIAYAQSGEIRMDASNTPWVVLEENVNSTNKNTYVRYYSNNAWKTFGPALDNNESNDTIARSINLDAAGKPIVAYSEKINDNISRAYVKRYNQP